MHAKLFNYRVAEIRRALDSWMSCIQQQGRVFEYLLTQLTTDTESADCLHFL